MSSRDHRGKTKAELLTLLGAVALIAIVIGAAGSVGLMLYAGRRNPSRLLILMFVIWVLSPFVLAMLARIVSTRWSDLTRATLYVVTLVLTVSTLAIYAQRAFGPPRPQAAFMFIVVPPVSWLLIAIVVGIAGIMSGGFGATRSR